MEPKPVRVDQSLHGYSRGHKEIMSSIELDQRSHATMLMMSDLLAVSDIQPGEAYLTIYPLRTASRHVIARTWAAGKGYRPGSVWTHSLILDYQTLTLINDLAVLRPCFAEPSDRDYSRYSRQVWLDGSMRVGAHCADDRGAAALHQLYGDKARQVVELPRKDAEYDEAFTLAVWSQMWPALRRDFAAITNGGDGPVPFDSGCILRFLDSSPTNRIASVSSNDVGLKALLVDLPKTGPTPLRTFLGRYVIEASEPRRLAPPLAELWASDKAPLESRLSQVRRLSFDSRLPRLIKDTVTTGFSQLDSVGSLVRLVDFARDEPANVDLQAVSHFTSIMGVQDLEVLMSLVRGAAPTTVGGEVYLRLFKTLPAETLAQLIDKDERIQAATLRPEIIANEHFWPADDHARAELVRCLPAGSLSLFSAWRMFQSTIGEQTVSALLAGVDEMVPWEAAELLGAVENVVRDAVAQWIISESYRLQAIAAPELSLDRRAIETLAGEQVKSGAKPNQHKVWADLITRAFQDRPSGIGALNSVGYLSALKEEGERAIVLAHKVFDPLYGAVRSRSLSWTEENYLSRNITRSSSSWSLSKTLLQAVLNKWPVTEHSTGAFAITSDEGVQDELIDEILIRHGREGLELVFKNIFIPARARARINHRLNPSKPKKGESPWSWLFGS